MIVYNLKYIKRAGLMLTTLATIKRMDGAFRVAYATFICNSECTIHSFIHSSVHY